MKAQKTQKIIGLCITFLLTSMVFIPTIYGQFNNNSYTNQPIGLQISQYTKQSNFKIQKSSEHSISMNRNIPVYLRLPSSAVTLKVQHTGPYSYFASTLSNVPTGFDVSNTTYLGWCTDLDHNIQSNHAYSVTLHNSYNTSLPQHLYHQNWSKINYIINHKQGSNWWQVQYALYYLLDFGDEGLNADGWAMVNNASQYGGNYVPGIGDVVAVIIDAGTNVQRTIIEVAIPSFTISLQTIGNGTISKNPDQTTYLYGTTVNLTANPDLGWSFSHWSGDVNGTNNPTQIIIDEDKNITATFTEDQYILALTIIGNGSVTKTPDLPTYTYGTIVTLSATADLGWSFDSWSGDLNSTNNPETILMTGNKYVTATFTQDTYILNISVNGTGTVTIDPLQTNYTYGTIVNLTAKACPWWQFSHWTGDLQGTTNPQTLIMDSDKSVTAHFILEEYTLTTNVTGNGSIIRDPDQQIYTAGTLVNLTAVPDEGWHFIEWTGDVTGSENPTQLLMDSNKTVTAHFSDQYILDINITGEGTVTKTPDQPTYSYGTEVEIQAIPLNGWLFSHWTGDVTGSENPTTIIIDEDKQITAVFTKAPDTTPPTVEITKPENAIYILDNRVIPFKLPMFFRGLTIEAEATDNDSGISHVEFYINGELVSTDTEAPYTHTWRETGRTKLRNTVRVVAYDNVNNSNFDEITVLKWRFHPILISLLLFIGFIIYRGDN